MRSATWPWPTILLAGAAISVPGAAGAPRSAPFLAPLIQVLPHALAPRVDIIVRDAPFTSYHHLWSFARPVLYPLRAATGVPVTPGSDPDPAAAEELGLWFGHGDVNGIDFSGTGSRGARSGRIVHRRVIEATSSDSEGRLALQTAWTGPDRSTTIVTEDTFLTFRQTERSRTIDRATRLAAVGGPVRLAQNPRGSMGLRLAAAFPARNAVVSTDDGRQQPASAAGIRGRWFAAAGVLESKPVTVALFEHPENPGSPSLWRFGSAGTLELLPTSDAAIEAYASSTYRYRFVILDGPPDMAVLDTEYRRFTGAPGAGQPRDATPVR
jgi:hypothetical protein